MKASQLLALMEKHHARIAKLGDDEEIGAFALIVGPENVTIEITALGFENKTPFARYIIEQVQQRIDNPQRMVGDRQQPFIGAR